MFVFRDGFLYYGKQRYIPQSSLTEFIVREAHEGGLAGHFGYFKTLKMIQENVFWPKFNKDVLRLIEHCETCRKAKTHGAIRDYPLAIPTTPGID